MPGPKPKPAAIRMLTMTSGRAKKFRAKHPAASARLAALKDPPGWLTAEQKAEWAYVIENAPADVLKRIDRAVVAAYCVAVDLCRQALEEVNKGGLMVAGKPVPNPALSIAHRHAQVMLRVAGELGFTPASRARIELAAPRKPAAGAWEDVKEA